MYDARHLVLFALVLVLICAPCVHKPTHRQSSKLASYSDSFLQLTIQQKRSITSHHLVVITCRVHKAYIFKDVGAAAAEAALAAALFAKYSLPLGRGHESANIRQTTSTIGVQATVLTNQVPRK